MAYIYKITNIESGKVYVGKTIFTPERRWNEHRWALNRKRQSKMPIHQAMLEEGVECFRFDVIEECCERDVLEREIYWINELNSHKDGYNATTPKEKNSLYNNLSKGIRKRNHT
jgi:group I intron endonuclease